MPTLNHLFLKSGYFQRKLRGFLVRAFYWLENNNNVDFHRNGEENFLNAVTQYLKNLKVGAIEIFDVGANRGEYSKILQSKLTGNEINARLHLFEPTTSCFDMLKESFGREPHLFLNQVAVSNTAGFAKIYFDQESSALASLHQRNLAALGVTLSHSETVETVRMDAYIQSKNIQHIHLLKIDIEGHELAALDGMGEYLSGDFIDFLQFEYGGANLDSKTSLMELYALFEARGFVIGKIMPRGIEIRPYQPWMENFQYANYVAVSKNIANVCT